MPGKAPQIPSGGRPRETASAEAPARCRRHLAVRGRVQGVGFRPYVFRLAERMGLAGHVGNDGSGVFIEIEGERDAVEAFCRALPRELPPLARVAEVRSREITPAGERGFCILPSERGARPEVPITPDTATCPDCLRELADPGDRRCGYPFINCTHCGPRYSIVRGVPYDRAKTTMAGFSMCPRCLGEYRDPRDRRFHAQPDACAACGPRAWLLEDPGAAAAPQRPRSGPFDAEAIARAAAALREGRIVAVKGLGGFHLACRADDENTVQRLRARKHREARPLAVMVPSPAVARTLARLDSAAEAALCGPERPIVLCPRRPGAPLAAGVCGTSASVGLLLPYTPLHAMLLEDFDGPLVMTSGNPSGEPMCIDNADALARLGGIADAMLLHDRPIERGVDDSVVRAMGATDGDPPRVLPLRRARGFVPEAVELAGENDSPAPAVLAVGGQMKSAICLLDGRRAILSEHVGELENPAAWRHFLETVEAFPRLMEIEPGLLACDLHPDYAPTRWARGRPLPRVEVQHHHAHVVSCMAEHGLAGEVVGVCCDGTGLGDDGTIWGGELLRCDRRGYVRAGHLRSFPLPGGDAAARQTGRAAAGLLWELYGPAGLDAAAEGLRRAFGEEGFAAIRGQLAGGRAVRTSSLGRLFDAAAFLLGLCEENRYEAEAPMALEAMALRADEETRLDPSPPPHAPQAAWRPSADGPLVLDPAPLIDRLLRGRRTGENCSILARRFHDTLSAMLAGAATSIARANGLDRVCLTGGCFANDILWRQTASRLRAAALAVYGHSRVPAGDGGLALGQAVVAAQRYRQGER